jgi:hypothetical protein
LRGFPADVSPAGQSAGSMTAKRLTAVSAAHFPINGKTNSVMVKRSSFFLLTIFLKDLKKNGCNLLICNRFPFENNYNKKRINFLLYINRLASDFSD